MCHLQLALRDFTARAVHPTYFPERQVKVHPRRIFVGFAHHSQSLGRSRTQELAHLRRCFETQAFDLLCVCTALQCS